MTELILSDAWQGWTMSNDKLVSPGGFIAISPDGHTQEQAITLNDVFTCPKAAEEWNITEDKLKRYAREGKFLTHECTRSGRNWLITRQGMVRIFGKKE